MTMTTTFLNKRSDYKKAYEIIQTLRPSLSWEAFHDYLSRHPSYQLLALKEDGVVVSVSGVELLESLAWGKHAWVHELVTAEHARSNGHGERLLRAIHQHAENHGCTEVILSSGLQREDAHRFYERLGYHASSYVFRHTL
ncbi:GNAT family N-acetyltransferase [Marinococcus halophilus]|uniref:N-acetyltransferase GCN5 n=1 Tax=Marinococcus halophilus TaxID=1371 RepID=A0A510Y626_MARHA|nr:GNAT family N-acetyltransferase [Marinococcus halophilus]OZT79794.1 GNAT family N-acetyltransferase [Marinococcus halophilus]GEK58613.1 N-acetyltransferase GCN5 [Marinococcus halophilus]